MKKKFKRVEFCWRRTFTDPRSENFICFVLKDVESDLCLPVCVNTLKAVPVLLKHPDAILLGRPPKPTAHDLAAEVIRESMMNFTTLLIMGDSEGSYDVKLIRDNDQARVFDTDIVDGLAIAIRLGIPIYCEESLLVLTGTESQDNGREMGVEIDGVGKMEFRIEIDDD